MSKFISLPYWKNKTNEKILYSCDEDIEYKIFCLHSRFDNYARILFDEEINIIIKTIHNHIDNNLTYIIEFKNSNDTVIEIPQKISELLNKKIAEITTYFPFHALIDISKLVNVIDRENPVPESWLRFLSPYIKIPEHYFPFVRDNGIYVNVLVKDEYTYIQDNDKLLYDYKKEYSSLINNIIEQYKEFYMNGAGPFINISDKWQLYGDIDNSNELFSISTWNLPQLTQNKPLNFMNQIIMDKYRYHIPDYINNDLYRHLVAKELSMIDFSFDSTSIVFYFKSLDEANHAMIKLNKVIDNIVNNTFTVIRFNLTNEKWIQIFNDILQEYSNDIVIYSVEDPQRPFSISIYLNGTVTNTDRFQIDIWKKANEYINTLNDSESFNQ